VICIQGNKSDFPFNHHLDVGLKRSQNFPTETKYN
jgi:hypothetical protein